MKPIVTMREALADDRLLGTMMPGGSWDTWKALLMASMGESLTDEEMELFHARTGREASPDEPVDELAVIAGRRSGKTAAMATFSIYLSALCDWRDSLSRGEHGVMAYLAQSQRTAKVAFRYAQGAFTDVPMLKKLVENITADTISLEGRIDLEIRPANFRSIRGITAIGAVADELAYWFSDEISSNPDREILAALRPALATTGGPLIMVSSPYARRGELWEMYRRHYGLEGDPRLLVAQGASRDFNKTLPQSVVDQALARDPEKSTAEYLGQFRNDVAALLTDEAVRAVVDDGVKERPPEYGYFYYGFCDPSGGSSDSMTLGIAHKQDDNQAVLDMVKEIRPPFDPESVTQEFAADLKRYGIRSVYGDRYGGQWIAAAFSRAGIGYIPAPLTKSEIYIDVVPQFHAKTIRLLDNDRLIAQFTGLERRTGRGTGRDVVDHGPNMHDDLCNSAAGALLATGFYGRARDLPKEKPRTIPDGCMGITAQEAFNPPNRGNRIRI